MNFASSWHIAPFIARYIEAMIAIGKGTNMEGNDYMEPIKLCVKMQHPGNFHLATQKL